MIFYRITLGKKYQTIRVGSGIGLIMDQKDIIREIS